MNPHDEVKCAIIIVCGIVITILGLVSLTFYFDQRKYDAGLLYIPQRGGYFRKNGVETE